MMTLRVLEGNSPIANFFVYICGASRDPFASLPADLLVYSSTQFVYTQIEQRKKETRFGNFTDTLTTTRSKIFYYSAAR